MTVNCSILKNWLYEKLVIDECTNWTKKDIHVQSIGKFEYKITLDGTAPFDWRLRWEYDEEYNEYFVSVMEYYRGERWDSEYVHADLVKNELNEGVYHDMMIYLGYHIANCF